MALALDAGLSTRHLSFIETGRSRPSPEVLMAVADQLDVPLRERNTMLLAAGYAPRYAQRSLQAPDMRPVQEALTRLLDAHHPYPGLVLDSQWNVVQANKAAMGLASLLPEALRTPTLNIYRASLHPEGLARFTRNLEDWAVHLLANLRRSIESSGDPSLIALEAEVLGYPRIREAMGEATREATRRAPASNPQPLLVPCLLDLPGASVSLFTTLTSFGTPQDVTLQELCIELFYPADAASEQALRALAA
jgi:transcriptional regulator with XRE-family HTH domain